MDERPGDPGFEDELRSRFAAAREADARRAPEFRAVLEGARTRLRRERRRRARRWTVGVGGLAAAAAAVAGLLLIPGGSDAGFDAAVRSWSEGPGSGGWSSPTRSLLDVPGGELLRSVPIIHIPPRPLAPGDAGTAGGA